MRNYVIINGVNSLTIKGLAINELPPIVKAPMRVLQEEIDGRDGDIITDLGYGAYDKIMTIGLYDGYDINEIIAFFNNEGTIVFSDEADKYYNFKIIEQIDYERLTKFRTASITFHCQPFKYPLTETPVEITNEYVEAEGTNLTLTPTALAPISIDLKGNTYQDSTTGKNKLPITNQDFTIKNVRFKAQSNGHLLINGTASGLIAGSDFANDNYIPMTLQAGSYTFSRSSVNSNVSVGLVLGNGSTTLCTLGRQSSALSVSFMVNETTTCYLFTYITSGSVVDNYDVSLMVESGTSATSFEPYTNGASPNPDYPQEIHNVSGDNTIVVEGKNKFNPTYAVQTQVNNQEEVQTTNLYTLNQDGSISCSRYSFAQGRIYFTGLKLKAGTYYVKAHVKITNSTNNDISWSARNLHARTDIKPLTTTTLSTGEGDLAFNFTLSEEVESVGISMQCNHQGTITLTNIMLCDEDIPYEAYTGQSQLISLGVENLYNGTYNSSTEKLGVVATRQSDGSYALSGTCYSPTPGANADFVLGTCTLEAGTYVISGYPNKTGVRLRYRPTAGDWTGATDVGETGLVITLNQQKTLDLVISVSNGTDTNGTIVFPQIEKGSKANSYSPYGTTPIELNKIGNYQDYFYKTDKWYKYGVIKKQKMSVLSTSNLEGNGIRVLPKVTTPAEAYPVLYCTHFRRASSYNEATSAYNRYPNFLGLNESGQPLCNVQGYTTKQEYIDLFTNNDIYLYYPLATPVITEITDSTLISQLEAIKNMTSYNGTTNISQENNDEPFILKVKAMKQGSGTATITNSGNIYSKPTIDIEGTGIVDVYIGANQIFSVNVDEEVIIDSTNLEAYKPDGTLANRNVTGNIANLKLPTGNSTIKVDGDIDKATITNYTRWL